MLRVLCVIRDLVAGEIAGPVISVPSVGAAVRLFQDAIHSQGEPTPLREHPEDFELVHVASLDVATLEVIVVDPPSVVVAGREFLRPSE